MSLAGLDHPTPDTSSHEGPVADVATDRQEDRPAATADAPAPIYEEVVAELGDPTASA